MAREPCFSLVLYPTVRDLRVGFDLEHTPLSVICSHPGRLVLMKHAERGSNSSVGYSHIVFEIIFFFSPENRKPIRIDLI